MKKTTKSLASLLIVAAMLISLIPTSLVTLASADTTVAKLELESDFTCLNGSSRHDPMTFLEESCLRARGNQERAEFTAPSAGTYTFTLRAGSLYNAYTVELQVDGNSVGNYTVTANRSTLNDFALSTTLSAGSHTVVLDFADEFNGAADYLLITTNAGGGGENTDTNTNTNTETDTEGPVTITSGNITSGNWDQHVDVDLTGYSSATLVISDRSSGDQWLKAAVGDWNHQFFQEGNKGETTVDLTDYCGQSITLLFGANGARTYTITGTLAPVADEYTVTMGTISNGTVTVDDATASSGDTFVVANGDSITLVATANAGYTFAGWSTNGGSSYVSTNATWTYTPNADVTITPVFEVEKLTITLNSADYASAYNYYYNDNAGKCYAVPFDFTSGLGDVKVEIISGRGYTNVFGPDGMDVTNLTTTSNSKSGTITSSVAADQAYGNNVTEFTINSESPSGRYFVAVSDSNNVTIKLTYPDGSITTLPLTTDYTVTVETVTGGTATVNGGSSATVEEGESVSLTATAFEGYTFTGWQIGDDTITDATYTYTPDADITITPIFTPDVITVTAIADNGTVTGAGNYDYGTQATLTVTANDGYRFTGWYVAGECVSTSTTYTFAVPLTDVTVTAAFEEIVTYTVTVESANTAQGTVTGGGTYESGTQATVIATAKTGYAFKGWYVGDSCESTSASYTFEVTGNITLTATFEEATTTDTIRIEAESADIDMGTTDNGGYWQVKTEPDGNFGDATNGEWLQIRGDGGSGEVYLPITIPESADGVTYTIKLVAGTSGDNRKVVVNLWKAGTGDETISLNGSDYYKYEDSELSTETKKTFSDDAFVAFENISLEAGTYYVGLYGENWAGFDYIEIVASEPVFEYVAPSYTVNATVDGNGTVAVTPEQDTFEQGSTVTVTVTPVEGYSVAYWTVNGTQVSSTSNTYTIEAIDRNYTIEAKLTTTYKVTTTVKAADAEHPYAFAEIELPESVFPQLYEEENWKNGFNITCAYHLTDYEFNGDAVAVFAVKTSSGKYYYQQSVHNLANATTTIPNCWYDPDDEVVSVILLVTAIAPAQNDFLENGDALVDLSMDFTVFDVETRETPYVDLANKTDNYIIYGNEIPVMNSSKPSDWQNNNGDSWVTFETVIDDLNEFEHRVWEIEYEFDRSNQDWDAGGTTGGIYAGRYYIVPDGDVHVDATGGSGFSFYYRTEVSNTEGIWITLQSNLFSTHEADDEGREPMKVYLEPTGGEWEACFVAYNLAEADGEYITYWDFFVDGSNSCVEANGTYTYVDPKKYGDDYITKMSADAGTFWFTELRLERYSNIIIDYKDMFGKLIEHRTDKVATIQDPPDFVERKGYDFLYWTYNGEIVGEYWTDNTTGEYVTPGTEGATKYNTGHFDLPVTESRIYVAMYQYNGELYNITVTNGAITNVSTQPVTEDQCRYETVLLLEASKDTTADFAYWVYGDYDVDEEGNKIAGTEKYSILSYKESFYTSVMGHADYIAVYQDDITANANFIPAPLLAYYSPDKTGNGATYYTSAADMKLYTSIFNRAEVFDSYHDKAHNKISFLGTIAYDEDVYNPIGWGTVVTNSEAAANTVGGAETITDGKTSDEMVISYENFLSATWYWTNVGTSGATIQKTSWTRTDVWDVILAGGQYLMSYTNLNNGIVRYARTFLVAEEIATGAVYMVYSDEQTKGEISAQPETVDINVTIKIDGETVETTTDGRVVTAVDSGCYTTGSGSVITTVDGFVRATPAVGYNFLGWDVGGDGTIDETSTKYEYSKLTANVDLVALFEKTTTIYVTATVATANGGRIASSVTNNQITAGTSVTIYAIPNAGFKFLGWYVSHDDVGISYVPTTYTSTDASYTFTPTEDCYAYAYFVEGTNVKTYTVTIADAEGGSATVDGETSKAVEYGTKVTLVATPNEGYEFAYWMINSVNGSTESTIEYAVSKNVTITPVFHQSTYGYTDTLTLEAEDYTDAQYVLSGGAVSTGTDGDITYSIINNDDKDVQVIPFTAPADGKYTITYYYQRQSGSEIHFDIFTTSSTNLATLTIDGVTYYETYYNGKYSNIGEATDDYDSVSSGTWGVKEFPMTLELSAGETILIGLCDNNGNAYFDKVVVTADAEVFDEGVKPTVTIVATNGTVTDADGAAVETGKYSVGTVLELYPVQSGANYIFSHWADAEGNVLSTDVCYTFTVEADTTVEAVFEAYTAINHTKTPAEETVYEVTVGVQNGNTVIVKNYFTGDKDNNLANYEGYYLDTITSENVTFTVVDRKLTLTAVDKVVADGEYNIFLGWRVNGVLQSGTTDEDGNHEFKTEKVSKYDSLEIIAVYSAEELEEYTVTIQATNGSVLDADDNVMTSVTGYAGSSATLFAAPEVGYIFSHWELDGVNVGLDIPYIATIVDDATLVAVFDEYESIETNPNAHVNKDTDEAYYNLTVSVENGNSAVVKNYYSTSAEGYYLDTITSATGTVVEVPADRKVTLTAVDKVVNGNEVNIFVGWYYADGTLLSTDRVCQVAKRSTDLGVVAKYSTVTSLDVTINYLGASEITYNGSEYTSFTIEAPVDGTTYTFTVGDTANYYEFLGWYAGETLLGTDKTLNYTYNSSNGSVEIVAKYDFVSVDTMPIVSIVTSNQEETNADPQSSGFNAITDSYVDATISVLNGDDYGNYTLTDAVGEVKGRGNSTWSSANENNLKRPLRIKLAKTDKTNMLNLNPNGKARNWVLLANNIDRSMYRNALAFELGAELSGIAYSSRYANVEVYINGVYQGVYLLCEQSEADGNRNDINEPENGSNVEIDAFIELDNKQNHKNNGKTPDVVFDGATYDDGDYYFTAEKNGTYSFTTYEDPVFTIKSDIFTIEQYNYLKTTIRGIQNTIYDGSESEIRAAINVESFVDMYILQEIAKNIDVGYSSFYMMLKDGVLYLTNPWDFDKAFGDDDRADSTTGLYVGEKEGADDSRNYNPWFVALLDKSWFKDLVEARWTELYEAGTFTTVAETITADFNEHEASLDRNWTMWEDKMDDKLDNEPSSVLGYSSAQAAFDGLMSWYEARIAYINSQYNTNGGSTGGETPDGETVEIYAIVDGNINATHINGTATPDSLATDDDIINAGKSGGENRIGYGIAIEIPELADGQVVTVDLYARGKADWGAYYLVWASNDSSNEYKGATGTGKADDNWSEDNWNLTKTDVATTITFDSNTPAGTYYVGILANYMNFYKVVVNYPSAN